MKRLIFIATLIAGTFLVWHFWPTAEAGGASIAPAHGSPNPHTPAPNPKTPPEPSEIADALNTPSGDIRADLRIVNELITTFRTNFPHDGNPVGDNAEITATLAGKNRLQLALIAPNHPAINRAGELCDRWGTPFFFHAESGTRMEIRSAGPDQKLFTTDDVIFAP